MMTTAIVLTVLVFAYAIWLKEMGAGIAEVPSIFKWFVTIFFFLYVGAVVAMHYAGPPLEKNARLASLTEIFQTDAQGW